MKTENTLRAIQSPFVIMEDKATRAEFVAYLQYDYLAGDDVTVLRRLSVPEVLEILRREL